MVFCRRLLFLGGLALKAHGLVPIDVPKKFANRCKIKTLCLFQWSLSCLLGKAFVENERFA